MAEFPGNIISFSPEFFTLVRTPYLFLRVQEVEDIGGETLSGEHDVTAPEAETPATFSGGITPLFSQEDWPDFVAGNYARTLFYAAANGSRLKERFNGWAAKPKFTCSDLVVGLDYIITVNLTEGVEGGPYSDYTPVTQIFTAVSNPQDVDVYLPIPAQGRQINISSFSNTRYFG